MRSGLLWSTMSSTTPWKAGQRVQPNFSCYTKWEQLRNHLTCIKLYPFLQYFTRSHRRLNIFKLFLQDCKVNIRKKSPFHTRIGTAYHKLVNTVTAHNSIHLQKLQQHISIYWQHQHSTTYTVCLFTQIQLCLKQLYRVAFQTNSEIVKQQPYKYVQVHTPQHGQR